jgi:hypothetical protein
MTAAAPARPSFGFTRHAVDRYIERLHDGRYDDSKALLELVAATHTAELVPRPSWLGNRVWTVAAPAMRWIAVPEAGREIIVTVVDGADQGIEEERIEYDALRVRRLLERIPQIGRAEATSPIPVSDGDYRSWAGLEHRRIEVERKRFALLRDALMTPTERMVRIRDKREARLADKEAARAFALTEQQAAIMRRNELLEAMAARLAEVDAECSATLLETWSRLRQPPGCGSPKGKEDG